MKHLTQIALIFALMASPAHADAKDWQGLRNDFEQLSEDTQNFFKSWVDDLGPLLDSLKGKIDDFSNYEPPEVLPNGDIIIRRKPAPKPQKPPFEI